MVQRQYLQDKTSPAAVRSPCEYSWKKFSQLYQKLAMESENLRKNIHISLKTPKSANILSDVNVLYYTFMVLHQLQNLKWGGDYSVLYIG